MKTRKHHSKSRYGCDSCKQRRTKCDEQGPPCANCVIRQADCHYSLAPPQLKSGPATKRRLKVAAGSPSPVSTDSPSEAVNADVPTPDNSNSTSASSAIVANNDQSETIPTVYGRLTELELMRHWCRKTGYSFAIDKAIDYETWVGPITALALTNKFLLDTIFALTCVHIATEKEDPHVQALYVNAALQYQGNAFTNARMILDDIREDNCDALFAFSLSNIPCSIVSSQLPSGRLDPVQSPIQSVLVSFKYVRMLRSLWAVALDWLKKGPFIRAVDIGESDEFAQPDVAIRPVLERLRKLTDQYMKQAELPEDQIGAFIHAVSILEYCFTFSKPKAIGWLGMAEELFLEQLKKEDDLALLMLMHWGVLLDQLQYMWWTKWTGKKLVEEISLKLHGRQDETWDAAIQWAQKQVGLETPDPDQMDATV